MSSEIDTKTRILQASVRMLQKHQGKGVKMGDIAKETGISRQALYLHFPSRTELLIATAKYMDQLLDVDSRLAPSRAAQSGQQRLTLFIAAWGSYIPEIYSAARSLLSSKESDPAAAAAWQDRMLAMKDGCRAAIEALHADCDLASNWDTATAIDMLWTLLSVHNWENLTVECGWSTEKYVEWLTDLAVKSFVKN